MKMFAIKDAKSEGFNIPFCQATFGLAERAFKEAAKDESTQICKNKEDFALYYVGDFDHTTGLIAPQQPQLVCNAI